MITQGLTQDQKRLFDFVNTLVGATPTYANLFFQGAIAGSEFLTYNAKKLYMCFDFIAGYNNVPDISAGNIAVYNEGNALSLYLNNNVNSDANHYWLNTVAFNNFYFSRIIQSEFTYMLFNGIKVTWP